VSISDALQAPGERHRPDHRADRRHRQQARDIAGYDACLAFDAAAR
jgi:hypothetical protein